MEIPFAKYHALRNDFLVVEAGSRRMATRRVERLAAALCDRRTGVGADGILYLGASKKAELRADVYNADGSWAEKSGNGLRIIGLHEFLKSRTRKRFTIEMGGEVSEVRIGRRSGKGYVISTDLGKPSFEAASVPVNSKQRYMIQAPLKIGNVELPVTCLSVGNPHTILYVDNFDFDWQTLGGDIEIHDAFPERTNVEFVKILSPKKLQVAEWERGAGPTGSSGTGAAAAVVASVMSGFVDRDCEVQFEPGSIQVTWHEKTDIIELAGPVEPVCTGSLEFS